MRVKGKEFSSLSDSELDDIIRQYSQRDSRSRGGGGTTYNSLYQEAPPERGTIFRLQVYKRVGISQFEVYKRVGKSVI